MAEQVRVPSVNGMEDETLMKHMELRHADDLSVQPAKRDGQLVEADLWRTYHDTMHRLYPRKYDHKHPDVVRG